MESGIANALQLQRLALRTLPLFSRGNTKRDLSMDDADKADLQQQRLLEAQISQIRGNATTQGEIGHCEDCGDNSRVIGGLCVECRKVIEQKNKNWRV